MGVIWRTEASILTCWRRSRTQPRYSVAFSGDHHRHNGITSLFSRFPSYRNSFVLHNSHWRNSGRPHTRYLQLIVTLFFSCQEVSRTFSLPSDLEEKGPLKCRQVKTLALDSPLLPVPQLLALTQKAAWSRRLDKVSHVLRFHVDLKPRTKKHFKSTLCSTPS